MKLKELLNNIPVLECTADPELEISAVHYDSRKVTEGSLLLLSLALPPTATGSSLWR